MTQDLEKSNGKRQQTLTNIRRDDMDAADVFLMYCAIKIILVETNMIITSSEAKQKLKEMFYKRKDKFFLHDWMKI